MKSTTNCQTVTELVPEPTPFTENTKERQIATKHDIWKLNVKLYSRRFFIKMSTLS